MTITLNILPEVQVELARRAIAQGRALEAYVAAVLEDAAHLPVPGRLTEDRLESTVRDMARFSRKIPSLSDEALTREALYETLTLFSEKGPLAMTCFACGSSNEMVPPNQVFDEQL